MVVTTMLIGLSSLNIGLHSTSGWLVGTVLDAWEVKKAGFVQAESLQVAHVTLIMQSKSKYFLFIFME
jgi:hypothetical protein